MLPPKINPTLEEMQAILASAERCLTCSAADCDTSGDPCFEFTPEGVQVCAALTWWNGRPIGRETLLEWDALLRRFRAAERRD